MVLLVRLAELLPRFHQLPSLLKLVTAPIGGLRLVADVVRQRMLARGATALKECRGPTIYLMALATTPSRLQCGK